MQRVLVICGAGASSTFLVHWMRRLVTERQLELTVLAGSMTELPRRLVDTDVVLVGHHLAQAFPDILTLAATARVRAELLPPVAFGRDGADVAVAAALGRGSGDAAPDSAARPSASTTTLTTTRPETPMADLTSPSTSGAPAW